MKFLLMLLFLAERCNGIAEAKVKELNSWKEENVIEEIKDDGQECMSVRWVIDEKVDTDNKKSA